MSALRQVIRGCGELPHVGAHPGTAYMLMFLAAGALAGSRGGWWGALGGLLLMGLFVVPLYLFGAYERANDSDLYEAAAGSQETAK